MPITVIKDVPTTVEMAGHHNPVPVYYDPQVIPGAPLSIVGVDLGKIPVGKGPAGPHRHQDTEIYLLPDYGPDQVRIRVKADETSIVESPALVVIPAGVEHCFEVIQAKPGQFIFGIFTASEAGGEH